MKSHSSNGFRRAALLTAEAVGLICLSACRGSDSGDNPAQAYAYVTSADVQGQQVPGSVYQFAIGSDGSLTPMEVASVASGITPTAIVSDPTGHYVYVANNGDGTISQYAIGAGGQLGALSPATVSVGGDFSGVMRYSLSVDPQGRFLYLVMSSQDSSAPGAAIAQYSIGSGDGTLTPLDTSLVTVPAYAGPLVFDRNGHAYLGQVVEARVGLVSQFSVGTDGSLSPLKPATVSATGAAVGIEIAEGGQIAYVLSRCVYQACDHQGVELYTVGTDGTLAPTGVATLSGPYVNPIALLVNDSTSSAYLLTNYMGVDTNTGAVYQYAVDISGTLVPETPASLNVASGAVAESLDANNLYALSANDLGRASGGPFPGGHVDHYAIGTDGRLTAMSTTEVEGGRPTAMTLVLRH